LVTLALVPFDAVAIAVNWLVCPMTENTVMPLMAMDAGGTTGDGFTAFEHAPRMRMAPREDATLLLTIR
jgi:hypothetical protein